MPELAEESAPLPHPFAFTSETDLRFAVLIAGVIATAIFLDQAIYNAVDARLGTYRHALDTCRVTSAPADLAYCLAPQDHLTGLWILAGLAFLLGLTLFIYARVIPRLWVRRSTVKPFPAAKDQRWAAFIRDCCSVASVPDMPLLFERASKLPTGLAFGRFGRYGLVFNLGLRLQSILNPSVCRAVVLHELAHIRNRDIDKAFLAISAAAALVIAACLPYCAALAFSLAGAGDVGYDLGYVWSVAWRALILGLISLLTLARLLRARETYADLRVRMWEGPTTGLGRALASTNRPRAPWWREPFLWHPAPADRQRQLAAVAAPQPVAALDTFIVGVVAATASRQLELLLQLLLSGSGAIFVASVLAGLVFGSLVATFVGVALCRLALAAVFGHPARLDLRALGVGLGAGLVVGQYVSLTVALGGTGAVTYSGFDATYSVIAAVVLVTSLQPILRWMNTSVSTFVKGATHRTSIRFPISLTLGTWAGVLGAWFGVVLLIVNLGLAFLQLKPDAATLLFASTILLLSALASLLLAWLAMQGLAVWRRLWLRPQSADIAPRWRWQPDVPEGRTQTSVLEAG